MNNIDVTIVRIYITESSHLLKTIVSYLKSEGVQGFSVFRAISGYGETGEHTSSLIDLSLDLPLVIEFFTADTEKVEPILTHLSGVIKAKHIISWTAKMKTSVR